MIHRSVTRVAARRGVSTLPLRVPLELHPHLRLMSSAPPTILSGAFWRSLIPKPLRKENREQAGDKKKVAKKEWNPATFFIAIFLLIGSMSIQFIALRNSFSRYTRQSEIKIAQLREVVERIQRGEDVDVEKMLGTGEPQQEAEWEDVLRAIERDEGLKKPAKKNKLKPSGVDTEAAPQPADADTQQQQPSTVATASTGKSGSSFGSFF